MALYKINRLVGSIHHNGRAIQAIYKLGRIVWISEIQSCYANGVWMDKYPWTDGHAWKDN